MDKKTVEACIVLCERLKMDRSAMHVARGNIELARESTFTASEISAGMRDMLSKLDN